MSDAASFSARLDLVSEALVISCGSIAAELKLDKFMIGCWLSGAVKPAGGPSNAARSRQRANARDSRWSIGSAVVPSCPRPMGRTVSCRGGRARNRAVAAAIGGPQRAPVIGARADSGHV